MREFRGVEERYRYWSRDEGSEERELRKDIRERMDRRNKGWGNGELREGIGETERMEREIGRREQKKEERNDRGEKRRENDRIERNERG